MGLKGLNQAALGRLLGVSRAHAGRIINGPSSPTLSTVESIANVLQLPAFFLILFDLQGGEGEDFLPKNAELTSIQSVQEALISARVARFMLNMDEPKKEKPDVVQRAKKTVHHSRQISSTRTKRKGGGRSKS